MRESRENPQLTEEPELVAHLCIENQVLSVIAYIYPLEEDLKGDQFFSQGEEPATCSVKSWQFSAIFSEFSNFLLWKFGGNQSQAG